MLNTGHRRGGTHDGLRRPGREHRLQGLLDVLPEGDRRDRQAARHRRRPGDPDPARAPRTRRARRPFPPPRGRAAGAAGSLPARARSPRSRGAAAEDARPMLPEELDDRAWDGVEPLLAIADLAGGDWPLAARAACVELYGGRQLEDESTGIRLLADIHAIRHPDRRRRQAGSARPDYHRRPAREVGRTRRGAVGRLVREADHATRTGEVAQAATASRAGPSSSPTRRRPRASCGSSLNALGRTLFAL